MVCGSIASYIFFERNINVQNYFHNVLESVAIAYLQQLDDPIFQNDDARPSTAAVPLRLSSNCYSLIKSVSV